jgi:pimeloyl-ACP methyl ester carboxylesterase
MRDFYSPEGVDAERLERELDFLREYPRVLESMVDVAQGDPEKQLLSGAPAIRCPALFLHGERDALVPPSHALTLHEAIVAAGGQSEFRLVGAAGHMLMEQRAPELCAEILAFLASEAR